MAKLEVDTPADKLSEIKAKRLAHTLGHVNSEVLLNMPAHSLAELQFKEPGDKLCDVKALKLVDVLGKILAGKKKKTDTPRISER